MKNLANILQHVHMNVFQKIAFIEDALQHGHCPIAVAETMQMVDYNNREGHWLIETESAQERKERKAFAKTEYYASMSILKRMADAYADERTLNGR